jgi:membrane protein DedA with SNARE-associated domain
MDTTFIAGVIRAVLAALAGYLAGKGVDITGLLSPETTGAIATVGVAIWSVISKKKSQ